MISRRSGTSSGCRPQRRRRQPGRPSPTRTRSARMIQLDRRVVRLPGGLCARRGRRVHRASRASRDYNRELQPGARLRRAECSAALLVHDRLGHAGTPAPSSTTSVVRQPGATRSSATTPKQTTPLWTYAAPSSAPRGPAVHAHLLPAVAQHAATGGYDSAPGDPRYRYGPANTGLLVWYNNNLYTDNEVIKLPDRLSRLRARRAACWWWTPTPTRTAARAWSARATTTKAATAAPQPMRDAPFQPHSERAVHATVAITSPAGRGASLR